MNAMLQRHAAKFIYIVPDGLRELMTDISREVLRSQPEDFYTFVADYLEALLLTRENARVAARLVQSITEISTTTCEFLEDTGMERMEAGRIASIIQKTFKKHVQEQPPSFIDEQLPEEVEEANLISDIIDEANISPEQGEQAAIIIQHAYQNFKQRKEKEKELLSGMIDWRVAARSAIRLYRHTGVTNEEANRAATLIKAAYKGYYTRRIIKKLNAENRMLYGDKESEITLSEVSYGDIYADNEEDQQEITQSDSRTVKINYDTVIPHVDFGDVNFEVKDQPTEQIIEDVSTASAVVSFAMQQILESTFNNVANTDNVTDEELLEEKDLTTLEPGSQGSETNDDIQENSEIFVLKTETTAKEDKRRNEYEIFTL